MKKVIEEIHKAVKIKVKYQSIDNFVFKLHYRWTTWLMFIMVVMISAQELIGEHIRCIADKGVPGHIIDRFCYFTPTYTVIKYLTTDLVDSHAVAHPGVGAIGINAEEPIKRHAYYQWVPFVIALQGIMFYIPHLIWKSKEGGKIKVLADSVEYAAFAIPDKEVTVGGKFKVPKLEEIDKRLGKIRGIFKDRLVVNRSWAFWLIFCETLNLLNVILQVYLTQQFLSHQFYTLGSKFMKPNPEEVDILDVVFPKITKCTFHKYGASGTIQSHDAMCVMALNIINEKIFIFLWFWYIILFTLTGLNLIWRMMSYLMHARSMPFNKMVFSFKCPGKINPWHIMTVTRESSFLDWLFLLYLSENMDGLVFSNFFIKLADDMDEYDATKSVSDQDIEYKESPLYTPIKPRSPFSDTSMIKFD